MSPHTQSHITHGWPSLNLEQLQNLESGTHVFVRLVHEAGGDPIAADLRADLLPSDAADDKVEKPNSDYAVRHIEVRHLAAATGGGGHIRDETITDHLAFRRTRLDQHNLDPEQCSVIGVRATQWNPPCLMAALF